MMFNAVREYEPRYERTPEMYTDWVVGNNLFPDKTLKEKQTCPFDDLSEVPSSPGIYKIVTPLGHYVGRSKNLRARAMSHLASARAGKHHNFHLNSCLKKPSECNFEISEMPINVGSKWLATWLLRREAFWMEKLGPGLNIAKPDLPILDYDLHRQGIVNSQELKIRIGDDLKHTEVEVANTQEDFAKKSGKLEDQIRKGDVAKNVYENKSAWTVRGTAFLLVPILIYGFSETDVGINPVDTILFHFGAGIFAWLPTALILGPFIESRYIEPQKLTSARKLWAEHERYLRDLASKRKMLIAVVENLTGEISNLKKEAKGFGIVI